MEIDGDELRIQMNYIQHFGCFFDRMEIVWGGRRCCESAINKGYKGYGNGWKK